MANLEPQSFFGCPHCGTIQKDVVDEQFKVAADTGDSQ
jgi:hypothetical protein